MFPFGPDTRIYGETGTPLAVFCVGPESAMPLISTSKEEDIPMDFDFGPILPKSQYQSVFTVRRSGEIYYALVRVYRDESR